MGEGLFDRGLELVNFCGHRVGCLFEEALIWGWVLIWINNMVKPDYNYIFYKFGDDSLYYSLDWELKFTEKSYLKFKIYVLFVSG